jgi:hypothetical protein
VVVFGLNIVLILQTVGVGIPGLAQAD